MEEFFNISAKKLNEKYDFNVNRVSSLDNPKNNSLMFVMETFVEKAENIKDVKDCIIFWPANKDVNFNLEKNNLVIKVDNPRLEYCSFLKDNKINNLPKKEEYTVLDGAYISKTAVIGENCIIMPNSLISGDTTIGDRCYIGAGTKIVGHVIIGNDVIIRENSVIGADGMSTDRKSTGEVITMPQFGRVIIHDNVTIGANVTIARGAIDDTIIGLGSKVDNSVFISHNVSIGKNCTIVGETIIFGSAQVGDNVHISGNSTIRNKVRIGEDSFIGMGSVVVKNIEKKQTVKGNPAK